jgi:hypothetical protein
VEDPPAVGGTTHLEPLQTAADARPDRRRHLLGDPVQAGQSSCRGWFDCFEIFLTASRT